MSKKHCKRAAENLREAFPWRKTPFPDLSDVETDHEKWIVIFLFLVDCGENGVENEK